MVILQHEKPSTPVSKSATPTSSGSVTPGPSSGMKSASKPPLGKKMGKLSAILKKIEQKKPDKSHVQNDILQQKNVG